jgi:inhibitor of KinA
MLYELPVFRNMGDRSVLVELGDDINARVNAEVKALFGGLDEQKVKGLIDIVPSYRSLLLIYDPLQVSLLTLKETVQRTLAAGRRMQPPKPKKIKVPVVYGDEYGPDLRWVSDHLGISTAEVIHYHTSVTYRVYMIGFTPGYPYMGEVPAAIVSPRRKTPRTHVPRGSVGIAQKQTGIYPVESPGGWQIIGRTPIELFDPHQQPPTLLEMGDRVVFYAISAEEMNTWHAV